MTKIRWTMCERQQVLDEVKRQFDKHPAMSALDLTRIAQKIALPSDRRRELTGTQQVDWVRDELDRLLTSRNQSDYVPIKDRPIFVEEQPKPDLKQLIIELLTEQFTDIIKEVIGNVKQQLKEDRQRGEDTKNYGSYTPVVDKNLKKIAIYGMLKQQQEEIESKFKDCFQFRFIKDVSQKQLIAAANWADHFIIITKFVSHDYGAIRNHPNVRFLTGGMSGLIMMLEEIYLEG